MSADPLSAVEQLVFQALQERNLREVSSYGWINECDPDDDNFGHYLWQTSGPLGNDWNYLLTDHPPINSPSELQEKLVVAGNDFEGMMNAGLNCIGLSLVYSTIALQAPMRDNTYFWLHRSNAVLNLDIASDRIRDFFNSALSFKAKNYPEVKHLKDSYFVTPFKCAQYALASESDPRVGAHLASLSNLADRIWKFREERNKLVHEIGSRHGKLYKQVVENQRRDFDAGAKPAVSYEDDYAQAAVQRLTGEIEKSADSIVDWYKALVEFSNMIFELEFRYRGRAI